VILVAGIAGIFLLPAPWNVIGVSAAMVIEVAEVYLWIRFLRRYRVSTGAEGMIGERGQVIEAITDDVGSVRAHGEIWRARADVQLERGERVRVRAIDGLTLEVEPDER